ncbi:hypothetical protein Q9L58_005518 [Maublancomyces gigas]|uniref:Uncharacterized protein n=1 Tax=Discina gigas TaxID=1032678 RepID=A0ABR3GI34_9PEZI
MHSLNSSPEASSPRSEPSRYPSTPCPSESSDESSNYVPPTKSSSCSEMELDSDNATPSCSEMELDSDNATPSRRDNKSESESESESESQPESDEDLELEVQEDSPPNYVKYQSGDPERTQTAYNEQDKGKANPQARKTTTHLAIPRPRRDLWTTRTAPYTINKKPMQNIQPEDAADTSDDGFSDESSGGVKHSRSRNQTAEEHKERLLTTARNLWNSLPEEDQQTYIAKCYEGWKCLYCQLLDLSDGCISQVSKYNCPTTIRRGVPCYFATYDEEKRIYSWKQLPSKKRRSHKTFDETYYVICGEGNPKTEQQFLRCMFWSRNRCLSCILTTKARKRGDRCQMQMFVRPESQDEESLNTCTKCARNQEDCMISIPMKSGANGEPVVYGLGRVTAGCVEKLGPRFHNPPKTPVAPRGSQEKRATSTPERGGTIPGEPSAAGAASERSRSNKASGSTQGDSEKKCGHSPTLTAQERSKKSKVRHLPTYSSSLSFVDQLRNKYTYFTKPKPSPAMKRQYRY